MYRHIYFSHMQHLSIVCSFLIFLHQGKGVAMDACHVVWQSAGPLWRVSGASVEKAAAAVCAAAAAPLWNPSHRPTSFCSADCRGSRCCRVDDPELTSWWPFTSQKRRCRYRWSFKWTKLGGGRLNAFHTFILCVDHAHLRQELPEPTCCVTEVQKGKISFVKSKQVQTEHGEVEMQCDWRDVLPLCDIGGCSSAPVLHRCSCGCARDRSGTVCHHCSAVETEKGTLPWARWMC